MNEVPGMSSGGSRFFGKSTDSSVVPRRTLSTAFSPCSPKWVAENWYLRGLNMGGIRRDHRSKIER